MTLTAKFTALRSSKAFIIFTICTACLTDGVTYGLVAPVIPFLLKDQGLVTEHNSKCICQSTVVLLELTFRSTDYYISTHSSLLDSRLFRCT